MYEINFDYAKTDNFAGCEKSLIQKIERLNNL